MSRLIWIYSVCPKVFDNIIQFILEVFRNFAEVIFSSAFLALYVFISTGIILQSFVTTVHLPWTPGKIGNGGANSFIFHGPDIFPILPEDMLIVIVLLIT